MRSYGLDPGTRGAGGIRTRDPSSVKLAVNILSFGLCVENMLPLCLVSLLTRKPNVRSFCVSRFTVNKKGHE